VEEENSRLKRLVADLSLDKPKLSEALRKKSEARTPSKTGRLVSRDVSGQLPAGLSVGAIRPSLLVSPRVRRCKHIALHRGLAPVPVGPTERWSMDFVQDTLADGRPFRILTVVDTWSRHSPLLEVGFRMSGEMVGQVLDRALNGTPGPRSITVDHGTEFQSRALEDWANRRSVQLDFIRPGKPVENAFIESCNGRLRDECLNVHQFNSLTKAHTSTWRLDYNHRRPHRSLGHLTPSELIGQRQALQTAEEAVCSG
jgi:putative transposase